MDFSLSAEQVALRDVAADLARRVYEPMAAELDRSRSFLPGSERARLAGLGLLGITLPEEYGGGGRDLLDALVVIEELAKVCPPAAFAVFEASTGPARVVDLFGTDEQKQRFLRPVCAGEMTIAVAISEPEAGSAATDMATSGRIEDDHVVINGTKRWCSGAGHAEAYLVYCRLGGGPGASGIGAVLVGREASGLSFGRQEELMGFRSVPSADITFDNVRVPVENIVVPVGGFSSLFTAFSIERLGNATMSLAIGQAALERSASYVQERKQFGRELVEFQMVQGTLADMVIQVEAARLLIYRAAANARRGAPVPLEASIAKCFANEMAKTVSDKAIQLHGGYGYSNEYPIERMHRDAHGWALAGGTTNMQRLRIVSEYLGRRFSQRVDSQPRAKSAANPEG
ncbi:MAG: acyl-CoA dehydrogenase family protein [Candidatus Dormibacteria bacterium]